jgi:hypothetical protein
VDKSDTPRTDAVRAQRLSTWDDIWDHARTLERELAALREGVPSEARLFGELMAVIHRDGGHYLGEHGPQKAYDDAVAKWCAAQALREGVPRDAARFWAVIKHIRDDAFIKRIRDYPRGSKDDMREVVDAAINAAQEGTPTGSGK